MSKEILLNYVVSGNPYINIYDRTGNVLTVLSGTFAAYDATQYTTYGIAGTQVGAGSSPLFSFNFPTLVTTPGVYTIFAFNKVGGAFAETDPTIGGGDYQWNGTLTLPLSDLATSGQVSQIGPIRLARGTQILNFPFKLVSSTDHNTNFVSGMVSGQISKDGGAFTTLQSGTLVAGYTEVGRGCYVVNLTSGDLLCNTAMLSFLATGVSGGTSDERNFSIVLQKTSGQ